jgi:hypothetical protein
MKRLRFIAAPAEAEMIKNTMTEKRPVINVIRVIGRAIRRHRSMNEKIRIVLNALRGERPVSNWRTSATSFADGMNS